MCKPRTSEYETAQHKCYVIYTVPTLNEDALSITLLESRSLLASSGTTGLRTWDSALYLGTYLISGVGRKYVTGKRILELGAGTGFLSILCAKYLEARSVLATDGSPEAVAALQINTHLNGQNHPDRVRIAVLDWEQPLNDDVLNLEGRSSGFDLIIGADVVGAKCFSFYVCAYMFELDPFEL